jgi:putative OmpL-like beta-barrel porin-2/carboxypeptidase family protein
MSIRLCWRSISIAALIAVLCAPAALHAQSSLCAIHGSVKDSAGKPVAAVEVSIHNMDDQTDPAVLSAADGTFALLKIKPGRYEVSAAHDGYANATVGFSLSAGEDHPVEFVLTAVAAPVVTTPPITNVAPEGFWKRFAQAYKDDWHPPALATSTPVPGAEPAYRGYPPVVSNPPFPFTVWPMGGTVWLGYNNSTQYPLTTALQSGPHGDWWKKANVQVYGWGDLGMNLSTSGARPYGNSPAAYAEVPNSFQLDQMTMYVERTPDTIQTDHFDWGFRFTALYGLDYRFTTADGYFSRQLLNNPKSNGSIGNRYGFDPVMMYVDLYYPHVFQGMDVRIGRYISLPDIEAQLAPNNYTYTHSLTYTYDCYTQTGINGTIKVTDRWIVQVGLSGGCEAAPWAPDHHLTGNACISYTWSEGRDSWYTCANSINGSKYDYNNLAAYYTTWYHKFGQSKWHMDIETWYQYMKDTPNVNNPLAANLLITNSNGAYCNNAAELTCFAPEWSTVGYVNYQIDPKNFISVRNEYFDDIRGQRTGFKTRYTEHMISWNHWIGSTIVFRPEIRYEHSWDTPAYNNGTKKSQLMFAGDMIFFY